MADTVTTNEATAVTQTTNMVPKTAHVKLPVDGGEPLELFVPYQAEHVTISSNRVVTITIIKEAPTPTNNHPVTILPNPPVAPSNLSVSKGTLATTLNLSWKDNANNESGFVVERGPSPSGPWTPVTNAPANAVSLVNGGLTPNTFYMYRIAATNAGGKSAYSNVSGDTTRATNASTTTSTANPSTSTVPPTASTSTVPPTQPPGAIVIPTGHPRTINTNKAKAAFAASPFTPASNSFDNEGTRLDYALHYVCSGNTASGRMSIDRVLNTIIPPGQVDTNNSAASSDWARWMGEVVNATYDWCYPLWTASERQVIIDRWNQYYFNLTKLPWGNIGYEANNYFWGYLRNELEWGIVTYHENPMAQYFIDYALKRYASFKNYAATTGRGGVVAEGTSYGPVNTWYHLLPFLASKNMGRDLFAETPFWREAVMAWMHGTTPGLTTRKGDNTPRYEYALFNDVPYPDTASQFTSRPYSGDMMAVMASLYPNEPVGQYAKAWLDKTKPMLSKWVSYTVDYKGVIAKPLTDLPLDYHAVGTKHLFGRSANGWMFFQMGKYAKVGHWHQDAGSAQLWRDGKWITRITAGSYKKLVGYGGREIQNPSAEAHNLALIGGIGPQKNGVEKGDTSVLSVTSTATESRALVDFTDVYLSDGRQPSPPITRYTREIVFNRADNSLTVTDTITATAATKLTQCWHSETATPPFTLSPAATRIVDEGQWGQFRHEVEIDAPVGTTALTVKLTPL